MGNEVTLGATTRENLGALKSAQALAARSAARISTGLTVSSAKDDAVAYFQSLSLANRSKDFVALKEGINQAISALTATLDGIAAIEGLVKQLKGLAKASGGMTSTQRTDAAAQWDSLREQITNLAEDTVYNGATMISNTQGITVDVAPAGIAQVAVAGKDLRVSNEVANEDIKAVWLDDTDGNGTYTIATRDFSTNLAATGNENVSSIVAYDSGRTPEVVRTLDGGTATVYSKSITGGYYDVYLRVLDASGAEKCADINIGASVDPGSVAVLNDGKIVVSSANMATGKYIASRYNADGTPDNDATDSNYTTLMDCTFTASNCTTSVTATTDGGFAISIHDDDETPDGVYYGRFDSSGTLLSGPTQVATGSSQENTFITGLTGGGAVVTWDDPSLTPAGVMARMVNSSGAMVGSAFRIDSGAQAAYNPRVAALADGGFVVSWYESGTGADAYAQVHNADGSVRTSSFLVSGGANHQRYPDVAGLPSGGFVVSWSDQAADGSGYGSYMASYDAQGAAANSATLVNQTTTNNQQFVVIANNSLSDLVAASEEGGVNIRKAVNYANFATDVARRQAEADIETAINNIRSAAGHFVSSLTLLSTRMDFNQAYAGTLSTGANKLTLADLNEEGANMLAMQSRTQLSAQALTFTSKAEQDILQMLR
jgi:flagellin